MNLKDKFGLVLGIVLIITGFGVFVWSQYQPDIPCSQWPKDQQVECKAATQQQLHEGKQLAGIFLAFCFIPSGIYTLYQRQKELKGMKNGVKQND